MVSLKALLNTPLEEIAKILREDLKAWRRGERRVVPRFDVNGRLVRGRVYERPGDGAKVGELAVKTRGWQAKMTLRVYRAATDTWEDPIEVPAKVERTE